MTVIWTGLAVFAASCGLTALLRCYALHRKLLDMPNERSSHAVPTPRGGGLAVVLTALLALPVLVWAGELELAAALAFGGAGAAVALAGWLDDHGHVSARWRLLTHFAAAAWGLYWLGGPAELALWQWGLSGHWLWLPALLALVWLLNLYNFMDGIDGIAGVEAVTVCLGAAALAWLTAPAASVTLPAVLVLAVLGFLVWNWPPAKIFMGDAGSGFVGLWLGLLGIQAWQWAPELLFGWVILLGSFVVDATVTLARRAWHRETLYHAHRSHAYQHLARRWGHRPVTLLYGAINLFWLWPIAAWVATGGLDGATGLLLAYGPLALLAYRAGAGRQTAPPKSET